MENSGLFHILAFTACLLLPTPFSPSAETKPKQTRRPDGQLYFVAPLTTSQGQQSVLFHSRQEERRRRSFQDYTGQKITLEAVLNTTCKKCGCKGHFAKDCFMQPGGTKYSLIPEEEEEKGEAESAEFEKPDPTRNSSRKRKKEKKKKKHRDRKSSDSDSSDSESDPGKRARRASKDSKAAKKKKKKKHKKKHKE